MAFILKQIEASFVFIFLQFLHLTCSCGIWLSATFENIEIIFDC